MNKKDNEEKQKIKFSDPIIDKYKDLQNIKHLGANEEFFELQKYVANLIYKFSCDKHDLLFNAYYYEDLFKVIRMFIAHERDKTICSNYKKRLVTVAITVEVAEEYFINEELSKVEYNVNIRPGQPIRVIRNNAYDPDYKYNEFTIDAKFLGTRIYLDIKTLFNSYSQIKGFDSKRYGALVLKNFKDYYELIISEQADDVWLLIYNNTGLCTIDFNFINMKTLMKYIYVNNGKVELIPGVDNSNPFKKDLGNKIIDIDTTFKDNPKIIFDLCLCYSKGEFIQYITNQDDTWL